MHVSQNKTTSHRVSERGAACELSLPYRPNAIINHSGRLAGSEPFVGHPPDSITKHEGEDMIDLTICGYVSYNVKRKLDRYWLKSRLNIQGIRKVW